PRTARAGGGRAERRDIHAKSDAPEPACAPRAGERAHGGDREPGREQVREAHAARMAAERPRAVEAVAEMLARQRCERIAGHVVPSHLCHAYEPRPAVEKARGHLRVLVDRPALVPAAGREQRRAAPHAAEHAGVELALLPHPLLAAPLARPAAAER